MAQFFGTQFGFGLLLAAVMFGVIMTVVGYCIYAERKISAWAQDRSGPNRVGPLGLLQPLADGLKFLLKEDYTPNYVDKTLFIAAPGALFVASMMGYLIIPWGGNLDVSTLPWIGRYFAPGTLIKAQVASLNLGVLYVLGVTSLAVYGVVLGGWASNNKYAFYGAMRSCAQMVSYEIPLGLCVLVIVLTTGSFALEDIVAGQAGSFWHWHIFKHPLVCLVLFITALAEANRLPFDLAEAEQELVGGYHTEYGALKFGLFFLAEYASMITMSAVIICLFFGGWHLPLIPGASLAATGFGAMCLKIAIIWAKIFLLLGVYMWIRWTLPRFRFDQLMGLAWKGLIPITLAWFLLTVLLLYFRLHNTIIWPLLGNMVVMAVSVAVVGMSHEPITGRQPNLPPLRPSRPRSLGGPSVVAEAH